MRAKVPEERLAFSPSYHHQVGIVVQRRLADNAGYASTLQAYFQVGSSLALQSSNVFASPSQQVLPKFCIASGG